MNKGRPQLAGNCRNQAGLTLVELLVVLAIIGTLAGIIYPAIVDSFQKSQAAMAAQRIDAVEKAKVQFRLDNPNATTAQFSDLQPYLVQLGQPLSSVAALNDGTGGTINIGDLANTAYFIQSGSNAKFTQLLTKYHVPLSSKPEDDVPTTTSAAATTAAGSSNP
jgi:prepilin-type N-terminal cleavage/methylation domain-containing protein